MRENNSSCPVLIIASSNVGKIEEFRELLSPFPLRVLGQPKGIFVEETAQSFLSNARIKAFAVANATGEMSLADDSGLSVDALNGAPGVYTARYAGEGCSYYDNVKKILDDMQTIPIPNRTAKFKTVIAYVDKKSEITAEGIAEGLISRSSIGDFGFGYDPVFFVPEANKTFAQMKIDEKEIYSHRGKAIRAIMDTLIPHLKKNNNTTKKEIA